MQATKNIKYEDCGRILRVRNYVIDGGNDITNGMTSTQSVRATNWYDVDGSASELGVPTIIGSAEPDAGYWWRIDDHCVLASTIGLTLPVANDSHSDFFLCKKIFDRQTGSVYFTWDATAQSAVGGEACENGKSDVDCTPVGYLQHWGRAGNSLGSALPVTLNGEVTGVLGGFGWHLMFTAGAPINLTMTQIQVPYDTKLMLSLSYPSSVTNFTITANAAKWCSANAKKTCVETFTDVGSVEAVRASDGNTYHWDGMYLYLRVVQFNPSYTGNPDWSVLEEPQTPFIREGIRLQRFEGNGQLIISAWCTPSSTDPSFCAEAPAASTAPAACAITHTPTAIDQCCPINATAHGVECVGPDGTETEHGSPYEEHINPYPPPPQPPAASRRKA